MSSFQNFQTGKLCPTCGVNPPNDGFRHCSRECAVASTPTKRNSPYSSRHVGRSSDASSSVSSFATFSTTPTRPRLPICPVCEDKPINPGYKHCSLDCALAEKVVRVATPANLIKMWLCETCGEKLSSSGYKYCSPECSRKKLTLEHQMETMSISGVSIVSVTRKKCLIEGCPKPEWRPGSKYCGNSCRAFGVILQLEPACLKCETFPKMDKSLFCSATCTTAAGNSAPCLLEVPESHQAFTIVSDQFGKEWKHNNSPPQIRHVYLIVTNNPLRLAFEAKLAQIDAQHNYKADGMFPANERRRWHGTRRECLVGDNHNTTMCNSPTCHMCIIMKNSFDASKCRSGCMFGKGIYTSGTSSKSHGYVKQGMNSPYRAIILTRVLAGQAAKLANADHDLTRPPAGFDSVRGVPGNGLNYDELIVYDNDSIRPLYLVIYDS